MFVFFLNLVADDCDCNKEFNVIVSYPSGFTITISKDSITLELTSEEAKTDIGKPIMLFIGNFVVTANVSVCTAFTVTASSPSQYITPTNHFWAICDHNSKTKCTLGVYTDKNATGDPVATEILNNQVIIIGASKGTFNVYEREIDVYATYIEFEGDEICSCYVPIFFTMVGP